MQTDEPNPNSTATAGVTSGERPAGTRSLNLFRLTVLVLGLATLLLSGLGALTAVEVVRIRGEVVESERQTAQGELTSAIGAIASESRSLLREVAGWDVLHQQLREPVDYPFWWRSWLMNPARIPHFVEEIAVYDQAGLRLDSGTPNLLPDRVPTQRTYGIRDEHGVAFHDFIAIYDDTGRSAILGYLGIRLDLTEAMLDVPSFNTVEPSSVQVRLPALGVFPIGQLPAYVGYEMPIRTRLTPLVETIYRAVAVLIGITAMILVAGVWLVHRHLVTPLREVADYLAMLRAGRRDTATKPGRIRVKELLHIREALGHYQREIDQLKSRLNREKVALWDLAHRDALSGAGNRLAFDRDWKALLHSEDARHAHVTFMMFDCDGLKSLNDAYGHDAGDRIIQTIAHVIRDTLREDDRLYRVGGDEFVAVLMDLDADGAAIIAARCNDAVRAFPAARIDVATGLSVSVGFATCEWSDRVALANLPRHADEAMYRNKHGRSTRPGPLAQHS
jgi:diguanylate cyclase (GGDEF)-like protein